MIPEVLQHLRFANPWLLGDPGSLRAAVARRLPARFVPRRQIDAAGWLREQGAQLVTGPRQAGKSSLVWSELRRSRRPLYVNLEEAVCRQWCRSPSAFLADVATLGEAPDVLFLEEAQWLEDLGVFVKGLVDWRPGFPIVVTGSASFQLRARMRESLAGRATRHVLLPFGLAEVAPPDGRAPAEHRAIREAALDRMLDTGGYPAAWLSAEPERILAELVQSLVFRDASDLFGVERIDAFGALLRLAAGQVGSLVNASEWASLCGISADTVARYLGMMEDAHLLSRVPAFSGGRRRELTSARKAYFLDNGLRNSLLSLSGPASPTDLGPRTENFVLTELRKALPWSQPIHYWRSAGAAEVDFVVPRGERILGIEVKAGRPGRAQLSRSSRSFIEAYAPGEFWVVARGLQHAERLGTTGLSWVDLVDLPERLAGWMAG